ncbi:MAG: hypothetical protein KDD09_27255, partial [Phaeodactylibacter sp.]|nr:hypothetical protein [Phaeodactylibacter sp.]
LGERREELEILAQALLEKEVLLKSDVERMIGSRPNGEQGESKANGFAALDEEEEQQPEAPREKI